MVFSLSHLFSCVLVFWKIWANGRFLYVVNQIWVAQKEKNGNIYFVLNVGGQSGPVEWQTRWPGSQIGWSLANSPVVTACLIVRCVYTWENVETGPHPGRRLRGLASGGGGSPGPHLGGVSRPTPGGGGLQAHTRGVYPSMHWGRTPPPTVDLYCCGRYASYWNAFLWNMKLIFIFKTAYLSLWISFLFAWVTWKTELSL